MSSLREVILTLQYCLETFEATCQFGLNGKICSVSN